MSPEENPLLTYGERRKDSMAALISLVENLTERVHELSNKFDAHLQSLHDERQKVITEVLEKALPEGDADAHRRWHESEITKNEARAAFWTKMRDELAKYGLVGFVGWALYWIWMGILAGPAK